MTLSRLNRLPFAAILLLGLVLLRSTSCRKDSPDCPTGSHDVIVIKNNSSISVNLRRSETKHIDTVWELNGSTFPDVDNNLIEPGGELTLRPGLARCWEYYFSGGWVEYYYFYNHDTVKAVGWEKINGTNRGLLKRTLIDVKQLDSNSFIVAYP